LRRPGRETPLQDLKMLQEVLLARLKVAGSPQDLLPKRRQQLAKGA
jgi:hypothetical protein